MIDLLLALILGVMPIDPIRPAPTPAPAYVAPTGTIKTIPDPLPFVLDETTWGPR